MAAVGLVVEPGVLLRTRSVVGRLAGQAAVRRASGVARGGWLGNARRPPDDRLSHSMARVQLVAAVGGADWTHDRSAARRELNAQSGGHTQLDPKCDDA